MIKNNFTNRAYVEQKNNRYFFKFSSFLIVCYYRGRLMYD